MAKKKSINYNPNTALIQGAAAAYRNYDNVAGMYQGLEKVTQAGANLVPSVIDKKNKEVEKRNKINKLFDDAADKVLLESGALGQSLYDSTYDELVKAKKTYLEGVDQKDDKKRIEGLKYIQNHSAWVQSHKAFNLEFAKDYKEGLMTSDYTDEEKSIMTKIQTGDYTKTSRNEQGDVVFHLEVEGDVELTKADYEFAVNEMSGEGVPDNQIPTFEEWKKQTRKVGVKEKLVSSKEYEKLASIFKNVKVSKAHMAGKTFTLTKEIFDAEGYLTKLVEDLPANEEEWRGMVGDDVAGRKGGKQSLKSLLEQDMADGTLEAEIITALGIDVTKFDTDTDPGLSDIEKANFIDAVVNTTNDNFDLETSNQILKERLLRVAEEDHAAHWKKINDEKQRKEDLIENRNKQTGRNLPYGFRTWGQMKEDYDLIQNTAVGDNYNAPTGHIFTRQEDGNYLGPDGKTYTPNQVKRFLKLDHLGDFEETPVELNDIVEDDTTETTETAPSTIAQQMLNTKRGEGIYNKFTKKQLRKALKNGEVSEDILKEYLLQIPGVSIDEKGVVKGLEAVTAKPFNNAMKALQKEQGINLGYN